jgi:alpha 1,3-glucosidase
MDDTPAYLRGGRIVPYNEDPGHVSSNETIRRPLSLIIGCDEKGHAEGSLYLDDGMTYRYQEKGEFMHRRFEFDGGVLKSVKADGNEKLVPEMYEHLKVTAILIYKLNEKGEGTYKEYRNLDLELAREFTWEEPKE